MALLSQNHFLHLGSFSASRKFLPCLPISTFIHWLHKSGRDLGSRGWAYRILRVQSPGPASSSRPASRTLGCVLFADETLFLPCSLLSSQYGLCCPAKYFNKVLFKPLLVYKSGILFYSPVSKVKVSVVSKVLPA